MTNGPRHARWVRVTHAIATVSVLALVFSGFVILMAHPRLYWGNAGNDLTKPLIELPVSRNYKHGGWEGDARTYDIFNQNGWGRSLHFLAAWLFVIPGLLYAVFGLSEGHFRTNFWPGGRSHYGATQKHVYTIVVFIFAPLTVASGLGMSPAITAAWPFLLRVFGGYQTARTIHFVIFASFVIFVVVHVAMVARSGFVRQTRGMTW
ncbi:MAG TPA: cytochrome b/b6 domain-containing protein [Vicinamibacterales bacterium]|nr:cytochrome b/b6 domain-containing protein [Vicinamibacterales bacterium]